MPAPFRVIDQDNPGIDLGGWRSDGSGDVDIVGVLRVAGQLLPASVGGSVVVGDSFAVLGNALGMFTPLNHNLEAWSFDPSCIVNNTALTNGVVYLTKLLPPRDRNVTKVYWQVGSAGATPTAGQNEVGLYSSGGVRLASTNVDADISSSGLKTTTISSVALKAGTFVWAAVVVNAATPPQLGRGSGSVAADLTNVGLATAVLRYATNVTGQTSLPASISPAANAVGQIPMWFGVGA